jgi:LytS/YehU family sensor histidine kinase
MDDELSIGQCLLWRLVPWELWALAMPLIVLVRRGFPATRRGVLASIPLHLVLFAAITVSFELVGFLCGRLAGVEPYTQLDVMEKVPWLILRGTTFSSAIYVAVLVCDRAVEYRARFQETSKHLAIAQLLALKTQLHPHFLFNTLNSISVLVRKADNELALKVVNGLAELLRYSLRAMKVDLVPVTEELDFIRRYLEIQGVRFSDRLTISIELAPEAATARLPSLILQPIVENAIKHGVSRRAGTSTLEIAVRPVAPARLRVEVRDDGPGPDAAPVSAEDGVGVGLAHVRSRLAQLYPDGHAFALEPRPGGGTMAVLELPFERAAGSR